MKKQVQVIYGPTASGKSARALEMARQNKGAVIINADAMQCYADLPLLTAQPSSQEQEGVPHKLYGFVDAAENMIAPQWREKALTEIYNALEEGKNPILVGGTGFYLQVLMEGLAPIPDIPEAVRAEADQFVRDHGIERLCQDLLTHTAEGVRGLDLENPRRVQRAWEVWRHTGQTLQVWQAMPRTGVPEDLEFHLELVTRPREELIGRINDRFDVMMSAGVLDEVSALSQRIDAGDVTMDHLIVKAHGFRPLRAYLQGELPLEEAVTRSKIETRQYAKRQMTWARTQFGLST